MNEGIGVLDTVAKSTNNDIILLIVVLSVVVIMISIPLYKLVIKSNSDKRKQELDREALIIEVVKDNTEVNSGIKTLIEQNMKNCDKCKAEQMLHFNSITNNQVKHTEILNQISGKLDK